MKANPGAALHLRRLGEAVHSPICDDTSRRVLDSGAIFWGTLEEKPNLRRFVEMVKRLVTDEVQAV